MVATRNGLILMLGLMTCMVGRVDGVEVGGEPYEGVPVYKPKVVNQPVRNQPVPDATTVPGPPLYAAPQGVPGIGYNTSTYQPYFAGNYYNGYWYPYQVGYAPSTVNNSTFSYSPFIPGTTLPYTYFGYPWQGGYYYGPFGYYRPYWGYNRFYNGALYGDIVW